MIQRLTVASLLAASLVLACASVALAQETRYPEILDAKPMFKAGPNHVELAPRAPAANLTQWNGSFKDLLGFTVKYTMVGTDPASSNVTTTVPVYIIPIKMLYGPTNGNRTFDPKTHVLGNGKTVVNDIIASPILTPVSISRRAAPTWEPPSTSTLSSAATFGSTFTRTPAITSCWENRPYSRSRPSPFQLRWAECTTTHLEAGSSAPMRSTLSTRSCCPI